MTEWVVNDAVNLLSEATTTIISTALTPPNVVFGWRWLLGEAGSPRQVAYGSAQAVDADCATMRPGDNLWLLSLADVGDRALLRAGSLGSGRPSLSGGDLDKIRAWLIDGRDLIILWRRRSESGDLTCGRNDPWQLGPQADEWPDLFVELRRLSGEVYVFDFNQVWPEYERRRARWSIPAETWSASYGTALLDAFYPDSRGRIPGSGPY